MHNPTAPAWLAVFLSVLPAAAQSVQPYTVRASAGAVRNIGDNGQATSALLYNPRGVFTDRQGLVYIVDTSNHKIRRIDGVGLIRSIAGGPAGGFSQDNIAAENALMLSPYRAAMSQSGDIYIADTFNNRVRRISPQGVITTVAGTGIAGYNADGIPAVQAQLNQPRDVAVDGSGNVYIADTFNHRIRRISPQGVIQTAVGFDQAGYNGEGQPPSQTKLYYPQGIAVDLTGAIYIADTDNNRIRKVIGDSVQTIAGTNASGYNGDNSPAGFAVLNAPTAVAVDGTGAVYIADTGNSRIRRINPQGNISTVVGNGSAGFSGDNGNAQQAMLNLPGGLSVDGVGTIYIADTANHRIRRVNPQGIITTVAGSDTGAGDRGPALSARLFKPSGLAYDTAGNLYIADTFNHRVRRVSTQGIISTAAGSGTAGFIDNVSGEQAQLNNPNGLAFDNAGNLYIADSGNHVIRKLSPNGIVTTVAGTNGLQGNDGDGGPAAQSQLSRPSALAFDRGGSMYIADSGNNRVRRVTPDGTIRHYAGDSRGVGGFGGDGDLASSALLNFPRALAFDDQNNLYIADFFNSRIRRINPATLNISTFAGTATAGSFGNDIPATQAQLYLPSGVAFDSLRNLYIADSLNGKIRTVNASGIIHTVAGIGAFSDFGDDGPAELAGLNYPRDVVTAPDGAIQFSDQDNNRVRKLVPEVVSIFNVVNAASSNGGPIAAGESITIYGAGMGAAAGQSAPPIGGQLSTSFGGTRVLFDGVPAPLTYVSGTQLSAIVPYAIAGKVTTRIEVEFQGKRSTPFAATVADAAPAIFTANASGQGQATILNQDGTFNSPANAAERGSLIVFYATGEGQTTPAGVDGRAPGDPLPVPVLPVVVRIGGTVAQVLYAGATPGSPGVMQINARVPDTISPGSALPVGIAVGSFSSQAGTTIAVK